MKSCGYRFIFQNNIQLPKHSLNVNVTHHQTAKGTIQGRETTAKLENLPNNNVILRIEIS